MEELKIVPPACSDCRFWVETYPVLRGSGEVAYFLGDCRRHAPVAGYGPGGKPTQHWPGTQSRMFCGDFGAKP